MASQSPPRGGSAAARSAFPQAVDDFEDDERVSFSRLDNKWILEDEDGSQWDFDENNGRWVPSLDEDLIQQQNSAYKREGEPENDSTDVQQQNKRKHVETHNGASKKQRNEQPDRKNSAVYVTSLPLDATEEELNEVFSRYGVIAQNIDTSKPRIKLYEDEKGQFKGDALIVYFRPESVGLAIQMLDDTDLRIGNPAKSGPMRVQEAGLSFKKAQDDQSANDTANKPAGRKAGLSVNKQKIIRHNQKMNEKLADWDDDDPQTMPHPITRNDRTVVLKHMFSLDEIDGDPGVVDDIQDDIREEAESTCGSVESVTVFDKEADGVVIVRFKDAKSANIAVAKFDTRLFGGQRVEARIADGSESFKKTSQKNAAKDDDDDDDEVITEEQRLERFGDFLEAKP